MPQRITVPEPMPIEECRQLAEKVADLHYFLGCVVEGAKELVPGESVEDFIDAWNDAEKSFRDLVQTLTTLPVPPQPPPIPQPVGGPLTYDKLRLEQLTGRIGKAKRSMLGRLLDRFFSFRNSEPQTDEKRRGAIEAAGAAMQYAGTIISSIPGHEPIVELLEFGKSLVNWRRDRGD